MQKEIFQFRFIRQPNSKKVYLLAEDVAEFIRNLGSSEETDVRNRLEEAANNILKKKD